MESVFNGFVIPKGDLEISLENYSKIICSLLDIPIYNLNNNEKCVVEAMHVLFSLYSEFKENKHFQNENKVKDHNIMKFN